MPAPPKCTPPAPVKGEGAAAAFGTYWAKSMVEFPNMPRPMPEVGSKVFAPSRVQTFKLQPGQ